MSFFLHRVGLFLYLLSASKKWQWVSKVKEKKLKLKKMPTHTQFFSENWEETLFNIVRDIVSLLCKYLWLLVTSELLEKLTPDRFWKDMVVERGKIELQNSPFFFFQNFVCIHLTVQCILLLITTLKHYKILKSLAKGKWNHSLIGSTKNILKSQGMNMCIFLSSCITHYLKFL